jgi:hypothetical protein
MFTQTPVFVTLSRIIKWLIEFFTFTEEDRLGAGVSVVSENTMTDNRHLSKGENSCGQSSLF